MLIFKILLFVVYCLVGAALAAPYIWLSGGNRSDFVFAVWFAPVGAGILFFLWATRGGFSQEIWKFSTGLFWVAAAYLALPIFLNWTSVLLRRTDYPDIATFLFRHRYASLVWMPVTLLVCFGTFNTVCDVFDWFRNRKWQERKATPPARIL